MDHIQIPALNEPHVVTADVTVCTPSLPHRHSFLADNMMSVREQTVTPRAHLIGLDYARVGGQKTLNNLIRQADTTWVAPLADDDIFYPDYLETLLANVEEDTAMIYGWCKVSGNREGWNLCQPFSEGQLRKGPYIPATVMLRKDVWEELNGYSEIEVCEDYAFQIKLLDAGYKIKNVQKIIWEYRFHGRNVSDGKILPWEV